MGVRILNLLNRAWATLASRRAAANYSLAIFPASLVVFAAATSPLMYLWVTLQVAFGLGLVIFVHEMGHFLVAKACGVQCDKFYIGFDVGGGKIWSRKWGETEYGIGIVPLGGYVKMLGQDDNPAKVAEEMRRARMYQDKEAAREAGETETRKPSPRRETSAEIHSPALTTVFEDKTRDRPADPASGGDEEYVLNPRSYLAKPVWQRMAIISAGVVMNVIFAFIFAVIAYTIGVPYHPAIVSATVPGSPAWTHDIQIGEEIVAIDGMRKPIFRDLKQEVILGDLENGIPLTVRNPESDRVRDVRLTPSTDSTLPTIGIRPAESLRVYDELPTVPGSAAAKAGIEGGDEVVAVSGRPIERYADWVELLAANVDEPLEVTVLRGGELGEGNAPGSRTGGERVKLQLPPNPMKRLGLRMKIGKITAVQQNSPAAAAGLKAGDFITQVDDRPIDDPLRLPEYLRQRAAENETVRLTIERDTETTVEVKLRRVNWFETSYFGDPVSAPSLGIAYRVLNRVQMVEKGSPAEKAGIHPLDVIQSVQFVPVKGAADDVMQLLPEKAIPLEPKEGKQSGNDNWPGFITYLQKAGPGVEVKLKVKSGDEIRTVTLTPVEADYFNPDRGLNFEILSQIRTASSLGEAMQFGWRDTKYYLLAVYRFLRKLGTQVPVTALGGPITIAKFAGLSAFEGPAMLLIFLTMLSANLAVVNFLPIPVLDGGHMVFLLYEAIFRRPVTERVAVAVQTMGLVFILGLMLFVISLDVGRLFGAFEL